MYKKAHQLNSLHEGYFLTDEVDATRKIAPSRKRRFMRTGAKAKYATWWVFRVYGRVSVGLVCHLIGVSVISEIDSTTPDSEFVVVFSRPNAFGLLSYLPQKISRLQ